MRDKILIIIALVLFVLSTTYAITRDQAYQHFGPQLVEALALVMRDEVNRLRQNPTTVYPEVTKAQMVDAIYAKYLTCTNYNWMSTNPYSGD